MRIYLLVSTTSSPSPSNSITIHNRNWTLQPFSIGDAQEENENTSPLKYSCISYTWGTGRSASPLNPNVLVSDRTLPALETLTHHHSTCEAIWVDAFCVPQAEPERTQTLASMGYIYAQSEEVMVVLSSAASPALHHIVASDTLDIGDLAFLEREEWVERAWTYQEAVNGKAISFTCEGEESVVVDDHRFFNSVGYALAHLTLSVVQKLRVYPKLDAFEDIMADTYTAGYQDRAALAVMSNMDRRVQGRAEDHFYAMIGAITSERLEEVENVLPCEAFMRVCENKGDFSFIYSASKRDTAPYRGWRPAPGELPAILPWHIFGDVPRGELSEDGLWLHNMALFHPGEALQDAEDRAVRWITGFWKDEGVPPGNIQEALYTTLCAIDFRGSSSCVTVPQGYFYPFEPVAPERVTQILICTSLRWRMGAPGLICYNEVHGKRTLYASGAFVGFVDRTGAVTVRVG